MTRSDIGFQRSMYVGTAVRVWVIAAAVIIGLAAAVATPVRANVTPQASFTLSNNKAGQHADLGVGFQFTYSSAGESVKNIVTDLPPGLLGNPLSIPAAQKCTVDYRASSKDYGACPASSKVGTNEAVATVTTPLIPLPIQVPTSGDVFLLKNQPNAAPEVPTRLGVNVVPHLPAGLPISFGEINLTIVVSVRNQTDYGLRNVILEDIPNNTSGVPIQINSMSFTLFKAAPNGVNFLTNPIRCDAWTTKSWATAYNSNTNADTTFNGVPYKSAPDVSINPDCGALAPFNPSVAFSTASSSAGDPASMTIATQSPTAVSLPVDQSHFRRVDVTLPDGVELNPAVAKDLGSVGCTAAQFNRSNPDTPATCPSNTAIADVTVDSPLVSLPLVGKLYIGQPGSTAAERYRLYIDLRGAPNIKLEGRTQVAADGRVTSTFGDAAIDARQLPQLPYTSFKLVFKGGTRAPFTLPATCGVHTGSVTITPWSGQPPVTRTISLNVDNAGGGPCPSEQAFNPGFSVSPGTLAAGSHAAFSFAITRPDRHENIRKVDMSLPVGFVAAPGAAPTCPQSVAATGNCPSNTAVGDVVSHVGSTSDDVALTGFVFNTVADPGEPARLTVVVPARVGPFDLGNVVVPLRTKLRDDYGVDVSSGDIPARVEGIAVRIRALTVTLRANAANGPFVYAPSSCGAKAIVANFTGETKSASRTATFNVNNCAGLAFSPALSVVNTDTRAGRPTGVNATVTMPSSPPQSTIKSAVVNMPPGFKINPAGAIGLTACSDAQRDAYACPASSKLGEATITSPLISAPLTGGLYAQASGSAPDGSDRYPVTVVVTGTINLKLIGRATVDETTGDVAMRFDSLPDLTVKQFTLQTKTGSRALVTNPDTCGSKTVTSIFTPHSGGSPATPSAALNVTDCPPSGVKPFSPGFGVNLSTTQSGDHPVANFAITRTAGEQDLKSTTVSLPSGFVGSLAAVPLCSQVDAHAGVCPGASQIGTLTAGVGSGDELLMLPGQVYLVEGAGGDIGGMALRIPAVAGPYDLGLVTVVGRVILRPDLGIDTVFDGLPTVVKGVPASIREVNLTIDGTINNNGSYMLYNASSCDAKQINASFGSYEGGTSAATQPYQATGCDSRSFSPSLRIDETRTAKDTSPNKEFPDFKISVTSPAGSSTIKSTTALLPAAINVNVVALGQLCEEDQFNANACPGVSKMGTVDISTPLLPYRVGGSANLVRGAPGNVLPRLGLTIDAPINLKLLGVNKYVNTNQLFSTFDGLPDVLFSELSIYLPGGPNGLLTTDHSGGCGRVTATFASHSGQSTQSVTDVGDPVTGCLSASLAKCKTPSVSGSSKNTRRRGGRGAKFSLKYRRAAGCPAIRSFKVTLPKGTKINKKLAKKYLTGRYGRQKLKSRNIGVRGRVITLKGLNKKGLSVTLTARRGAVKLPVCASAKRVCARRKLSFQTSAVDVAGTPIKQGYKPSLSSKRFK